MDEIVSKIGIDRIAHFGVGGLLCAMVSVFLMFQEGRVGFREALYILVGWLFVFVVSVFKERFVDSRFDWYDILAAMLGCLLFTMFALAGIGLCVLSR